MYDPSMSVKHESGAATKKSYGTEKKRIRFMMEKTVGACEVYLEMLGEELSSERYFFMWFSCVLYTYMIR